ncbi:MAG TPA: DUF3618 domain-containing protein [Gemmatimonadaceae bacterium]|nr:DUF3618 domain-containing protein [Gemmatimonadaceae bacterium]
MAETTADVRRDIEMTRERMSDTIAQLEHKLNLMQVVRDHPWPAVALAFGAGVALAGSRADVKAAAATVKATGGASSRMGSVLDDLAATVITSVSGAFQERVDGWVSELKSAIGAPGTGASATTRRHVADMGSAGTFGGARDIGAVDGSASRAD